MERGSKFQEWMARRGSEFQEIVQKLMARIRRQPILNFRNGWLWQNTWIEISEFGEGGEVRIERKDHRSNSGKRELIGSGFQKCFHSRPWKTAESKSICLSRFIQGPSSDSSTPTVGRASDCDFDVVKFESLDLNSRSEFQSLICRQLLDILVRRLDQRPQRMLLDFPAHPTSKPR